MTPIPDSRPYFFQHKSKEGYVVAIKRLVGNAHAVVILDGDLDLFGLQSRHHKDIEFIYKTLYQWLAYCPGDVPTKCEKMRGVEDISIAFQLLPLSEETIEFPDLKELEYEDFKKKVNR